MRRYVEMRVEFQLLPLEEEVPGAHPPIATQRFIRFFGNVIHPKISKIIRYYDIARYPKHSKIPR
jgi:hypothetical protein